jgi:serine/threonine protein kinase
VYAGTLVNNSSSSNNTNNNNKVSVALKVLDEEQVQLEDFKSELVALSLLTGVVHNVVEFKGYCYFQQKISGKIDTTKSFHCLVMELMETSLEKIIFGKKRSKLSNFKRMKKVAFDIAQGMSKLHAFGILHRDLKPANMYALAPYDFNRCPATNMPLLSASLQINKFEVQVLGCQNSRSRLCKT